MQRSPKAGMTVGRGVVVNRVGFIGLGKMGGPMARNLLKAGFEVTVYGLRDRPGRGACPSGRGNRDFPV